ncbi:MAG: 1-acyl-sn-glycerol-3-phosphate acyltransferase [Prolixibacteraceae bacterium]|nr:1-acyl-sn-glycerol-3-phosphate acyltransferase [Prolixibacteraceae bacterium]
MKAFVFFIISIPVFILLYLFTSIMVLTVVLLSYIGVKQLGPVIRFWAISLFMLMGKRIKTVGFEEIDQKGKYLLLLNHASLFDIPAVMAIFPTALWFGRDRLTRIPVFGRLLKIINYIPRTQSGYKNTRLMLEQIVSKSKEGTLVIFPEGTRTKTGKLSAFHRGFVNVLRASQTDILPVTLNGFFALKPKTRFSIGFDAKLSMVFHQPVSAKSLIAKSDQEIISEIKNIIESSYILT